MSRRMLVMLAVVVTVAGLAAGWIAPTVLSSRAPSANPDIEGFLWPDPPSIATFSLRDHHGQIFDRERLLGRWTLLYFGYTHCPDACPMSLSVMREIEKRLSRSSQLHGAFQGVFVSVDPARDTLEHLAEYVAYFSPRFFGVTGSADAMPDVARTFGVSFALEEPDKAGSYLVDHTSSFLLTDPEGRLVAVLRTPHEPEELAVRIERIHRAVSG